jgi:hypothetical protein
MHQFSAHKKHPNKKKCSISLANMKTHINHVIIKEQPESVTFDYADVVASVWTAATMNYHSHKVVRPLWRVCRVITLQLF